MDGQLTIVEAYLPDLSGREEDWYRRLVDRVNELLHPLGLEAALLALPEDEAVLWLISPNCVATLADRSLPEPALARLIATATDFAGGHVMERQVNARFVRPVTHPPPR